MISNELLAAVLGFTSCTFEEHLDGEYDPCINIAYTSPELDALLLLNLYELAHRCKEWAFSEGYEVSTSCDNIDSLDEEVAPSGKPLYYSSYVNSEHIVRKGTEPEAIFAACQYILDELEH